MSTLNRAVEIATKSHKGATDKYGAPYINHVTRVMNMGQTDNEKIVGVLHDVIEDTHWTFEDLEKDKKTAAELSGKKYNNIIAPDFQWNKWAAPKDKDGKLDHHSALTGDDLADFVNIKLFPYFKQYKKDAESADTIEYKIGEIFSELKNRIQSGYNLREVINRIDELRFRTHAEKHEMSHLYEDKIKKN